MRYLRAAKITTAAGIIALMGVITACGNTNSTASTGTTTTNAGGSNSSSSSANDTLSVGLSQYPLTLDPPKSAAWIDREVMFNIYDTLFSLTANNQIGPDLVTKWKISSDGLTYTFHLRQGVKFQDGTAFNAAAVKFNLERGMGKTSTSRTALSSISSIDTPNDSTVVLHLSKPFSPLLSVLTDRPGMMVSPTAVKKEGSNFQNDPVGTGPFMFKSAVKGDHITLIRNPHYWQQEPKIKTVIFRTYTDPNVEYTNFTSGAVQIVDSVQPQHVKSLEQNSKFTVISKPSWAWAGYGLNTKVAPFTNQYLREAVNEAINRQQLVNVVLQGQGVPAYSAISPSQPGYDKQADTPPTPSAANIKNLLQEGGKPNGFTFTLQTIPGDQLTAQTIQGMLSQYGITMKIQQLDGAALTANHNNGNFQMSLEGWSGRLDPDQNMSQYFYSNAPLNWVGYNNPQVDQLLTQARAENSMAARTKTYAKVTDILHQDAPVVFLYHKNNIIAYWSKLKGFEYRPDGMLRVATMYFAK